MAVSANFPLIACVSRSWLLNKRLAKIPMTKKFLKKIGNPRSLRRYDCRLRPPGCSVRANTIRKVHLRIFTKIVARRGTWRVCPFRGTACSEDTARFSLKKVFVSNQTYSSTHQDRCEAFRKGYGKIACTQKGGVWFGWPITVEQKQDTQRSSLTSSALRDLINPICDDRQAPTA